LAQETPAGSAEPTYQWKPPGESRVGNYSLFAGRVFVGGRVKEWKYRGDLTAEDLLILADEEAKKWAAQARLDLDAQDRKALVRLAQAETEQTGNRVTAQQIVSRSTACTGLRAVVDPPPA
jgi:hypothetical protein